jgi:DNA-binding transcriptional ArsR family regulator
MSPGDDRAGPSDNRATDPAERRAVDALEALGNEQRLAILFALADRERETRTNRLELSFTDLYEAVDIGSTSQFSYHLSRLVGPFVAETDGGYCLTYAGEKIARAIRSGVYESTAEFDPITVDGTCLACEEQALEALLRDERFVVRCRACEATLLSDSFPRSQAVDRTPAEVVASFGYRIWSSALLVHGDVCPECYGRIDRRVDHHESVSAYTFAAVCRECSFTVHLPVEVPVVFHPTAATFLDRHGTPLPETPLWELFGLFGSGSWTTEVRSTEPLDARVRIDLGGESLALTLDESFTAAVADTDDAR